MFLRHVNEVNAYMHGYFKNIHLKLNYFSKQGVFSFSSEVLLFEVPFCALLSSSLSYFAHNLLILFRSFKKKICLLGFLQDWDKPETIPDPDAKKPDDWDEEMDGEWEPPMVTNPEYKVHKDLFN